MAITAASVEANGWVLRVTVTGSLSSAAVAGFSTLPANDSAAQWATNFSAYALNPNTAPALTLAMATSGYVQSAGTAVASAAVGRSLVATKALRKAVIAGAAAGTRLAKQPDEVDNGDGTITVRIALSQHVYAGDSGLTLTALAGWRTGAGAASGIAVTNTSTVAAPAPIVRWADVPYKLQGGSFPLEVVVASHHPLGVAPVAGVRFTVTDGTNTVSAWATALATSSHVPTDGTGQPLRVFTVTIDPTLAAPAALTKGLLRCDFEVYPWVGPVQKSDTAGTKAMTGLGTAATATSAFVPFVVAYNPGGAWITPRYAYVNAATGAATAAAANVSTSAATAAATPLASINLAIESLRLDAVAHTSTGTVAAANGQAAITQSLDGCRIRLAAGATLGTGTTAVTSGAATAATWLVIEGDPADASPRADCILRTPTSANGVSKVTRVRFANLSAEGGTNALMGVAAAVWLDNMEFRGASGQTTATTLPFGGTGALLWATNMRWWQYGAGLANVAALTTIVARNCSVDRNIDAPVILNCARLPAAIAGIGGITGSVVTSPSTDPGIALERLAIGNDLRYLTGAVAMLGKALTYAAASAATATTTGATTAASLTLGYGFPVMARWAWLNTVGEVYGTSAAMWGSVGENNPSVTTQFIIEGNTFTGDRVNNPYGDLNMATVALNDTTDTICQTFRFANNVVMKCASKHDSYGDNSVAAQRIGVALTATRNRAYAVGAEIVIAGSPANIYHCTTAGTTAATGGPTGTGSAIADGSVVWQWIATENRQHGYRPQATGSWASHYGVGYEGNIDFVGSNDPGYDPELVHEFFGVGSLRLADAGLYVTATPFTLDKSGTTNRLAFQPTPDGTGGGNYKPLSSGPATYILGRAKTANVDVDSRSVVRVAAFAAGAIEGPVAVAVLPAGDRQASHAASSIAGWTVPIAAAATRLASRAAATGAGWGVALAANGDRSVSRAAATAVTWRGGLVPAVARSPTLASAPTLTGAPPVASAGTLVVIGSGRIAVGDGTLPILLPGSSSPAGMTASVARTLIVAGDFRTTRIA